MSANKTEFNRTYENHDRVIGKICEVTGLTGIQVETRAEVIVRPKFAKIPFWEYMFFSQRVKARAKLEKMMKLSIQKKVSDSLTGLKVGDLGNKAIEETFQELSAQLRANIPEELQGKLF